MTQKQLLDRVRQRLRDEIGEASEQLWSDEEILDDYGNLVRDKLFRIARFLKIDPSTAADGNSKNLCSITLSVPVGQTYPLAYYEISSKILEIRRIQLANQTAPLAKMTTNELDMCMYNWQNATQNDPWAYCLDWKTNYILFVPRPDEATTASLIVSRLPLVDLSADSINNSLVTLDFDEQYHHILIPGILAEAFRKSDVDTYRPKLADSNEARFLDLAEDCAAELHRKLRAPKSVIVQRAYGSR